MRLSRASAIAKVPCRLLGACDGGNAAEPAHAAADSASRSAPRATEPRR